MRLMHRLVKQTVLRELHLCTYGHRMGAFNHRVKPLVFKSTFVVILTYGYEASDLGVLSARHS